MPLSDLAKNYKKDDERQVLVTEVTRMSDDKVCVAGIDIHSQQMVRPLYHDGSNWNEAEWVDKD
jgi:hypothetical protein